MSDKSVEYEVTANPEGFEAAMERVKTAVTQSAAKVQEAAAQMQTAMDTLGDHLDSISKAFSKVTKVVGTLTAIAAGGEAFKAIIEQSVAWTMEAKRLSVQLGVTTERASVMMVAMKHLGIDSETLTLAAGKMSKQIATNGAAFETLGVKVKDANGQYRPTLDIMAEVNDKLKAIKNPIEQNIAGTAVYGKSWNEVRGILKLTAEQIKDAEQKAQALGLVVGEDSVAQAKKYKESLNDLKLVSQSLEVQFGNAVLPTFVKIGAWLSSTGPAASKVFGQTLDSLVNIIQTLWATCTDVLSVIGEGWKDLADLIHEEFGISAPNSMEFFTNCLKVVETAFVAFRTGVQVVLEIVMGQIDSLIATFVTMAKIAVAAFHMDWAGVKSAWNEGVQQIQDVQQKHWDKMVQIAQAGRDKMDEVIMRPAENKQQGIKDKNAEGGPTYDFDKDKDKQAKSRMQEWEAKLAADKDGFAQEQAIAGTAREFSLQQEEAYWKNILDTTKLSTEEKAQVERKYYAVRAQIGKEAFDAEIAGQKASMEAFKNDHVAREAIAEKIYKENVARYGADSKEAKAAMADVTKEERAQAEQRLQISKVLSEQQRNLELARIDQEEQDAQSEVSMHRMTTEQLLALQQQYENRRYQIEVEALRQQRQAMKGSDEDPVAVAKLDAQLEQLEQKHQNKLHQIRQKATQQDEQLYTQLYNSMMQGMTRVVEGTLNGSIKMSDALRQMMQVVTKSLIDMVVQMAEKWLENLIMTQIQSKTSSAGQITANAGVAGSAATASAAAIPVVGWAMAPEAGAAASAAAMAFMPMASAAGGYDIPSFTNPVVQTHAEEMVLPSKYANFIRQATGNGSGGNNGPTIHYHDHSGQLTPAGIKQNVKHIANALHDYSKKSN